MMRVTTFLKNWHKERLLRRIAQLEKYSADCLETSYSFQMCLRYMQNDRRPYYQSFLSPSYYSGWHMDYSVDWYAKFSNDYRRFLNAHNSAEKKIKKLKKKIEKL